MSRVSNLPFASPADRLLEGSDSFLSFWSFPADESGALPPRSDITLFSLISGAHPRALPRRADKDGLDDEVTKFFAPCTVGNASTESFIPIPCRVHVSEPTIVAAARRRSAMCSETSAWCGSLFRCGPLGMLLISMMMASLSLGMATRESEYALRTRDDAEATLFSPRKDELG